MNIYYQAIEKSFVLLRQEQVKESSFGQALECMVNIVTRSSHEVENCTFTADEEQNVIISLSTKDAVLTITAHDHGITYIGKGPKKEDNFKSINNRSYITSSSVLDWIKKNKIEKKLSDLSIKTGEFYSVKTTENADESCIAYIKNKEMFGIELEYGTGANANDLYYPIALSYEEAKKRIETILETEKDEFIERFYKKHFSHSVSY